MMASETLLSVIVNTQMSMLRLADSINLRRIRGQSSFGLK